MAVGEASRSKGGKKLDDGSSVIDKRCYGRSRKTRVRPASIAGEVSKIQYMLYHTCRKHTPRQRRRKGHRKIRVRPLPLLHVHQLRRSRSVKFLPGTAPAFIEDNTHRSCVLSGVWPSCQKRLCGLIPTSALSKYWGRVLAQLRNARACH